MSYEYRIVKGYGGNPDRQYTAGKPYTEMRNTQYQRAYDLYELKTLYLACKKMLIAEGKLKKRRDKWVR
jgi:hypothetical protein